MKQGILRLLQARELLKIMASQSASTYANQVVAFVIPWLVLTRTGSAANAGLVAFAIGLSAFVGILAGGLVTDRIGGRRVSMIADVLSLVTALALGAALFVDYFALWFVIVTQILGVFFDGPGSIAKNTMVPAAAKQDTIPIVRAMGLQQTLQNVAMFLGPVTAGVLIALLSESVTLLAAAAIFLLCVLLVMSIGKRALNHTRPLSARQSLHDMREAVQFIAREPFLGPMQLFGPLYAFVLLPLSAIVIPAWFAFAAQPASALGLFLGAQALGGVVGGVVFAALAPRVSQRIWLASATAAYALALLVLYFLPAGSWQAVLVSFLVGTTATGVMAIPYTAFYVRTPERLLGRVNSLGAATGYIVSAAAALFFGWLIAVSSADRALLACAVVMAVIALGTLLLPFMKHLDDVAPPPDPGGKLPETP